MIYEKVKKFAEHLFFDLVLFCRIKKLQFEISGCKLIKIRIFKNKQLLFEVRDQNPKDALKETKNKLRLLYSGAIK